LIREERQSAFTYYSLAVPPEDRRWPLVKLALDQEGDADGDLARLKDLLRHREDRQALNDKLLEPGQSFQLWARALGALLPRLDLGPRPPLHDVAIASQSLHFAGEPASIIRTARALLRPGGRLLVLELLPHSEEWVRERLNHCWLGFEPEALQKMVRRVGFR